MKNLLKFENQRITAPNYILGGGDDDTPNDDKGKKKKETDLEWWEILAMWAGLM